MAVAESCIFCGKTVMFWNGHDLSCGEVMQPVCDSCYEQHGRKPPVQRARLALNTGRAKEPEKLTTFIQREERQKSEWAKWKETAFRCSICGSEMELKLENFLIGADGGGGLVALMMDQYNVDLYACPICGKVEMYTAGFFKEDP